MSSEIEKPHLSYTQINMAGRCMTQYEFRYIQGMKRKPKVAMIVGGATHESIQPNMEHKRDTGQLLPLEAVQDFARDALVKRWEQEGVELEPEEEEKGWKKVQAEAIDTAISLGVLHHRSVAQTVVPLYVERPWRIEIPNYPYDLIGYIDIQEESRIRDTKTTGRAPAKDAAETDDQLTLYAMAGLVLDKKIPELQFDWLVKKKTPEVVSQSTTRTVEDFDPILNTIEIMARCIEAGLFPPTNPKNWWCSPKACGYWNECKYARRKR